MIDQRTDPLSRLLRAAPPVLRALGGDASGVTPEVADDLLALLDLAEAHITLKETPSPHTAWDPILSDRDLEYVMPPAESPRHQARRRPAAWERALARRGSGKTDA